MSKAETLDRLRRAKIVAVVRAPSSDEALRVADALIAGGIEAIELTMTVPNAVEAIRTLSQKGDALVGAGTVLDAATAKSCIAAGARFVVSPAFESHTVRLCNERGILVAPGALTPTEIVAAYQAGGDVIKVFPCDAVGGASYLKSLKGPLPHIPLMPTGGADLQTIAGFLQAGAVAVGVGSALVDPRLSAESLIERAQAFRKAVASSPSGGILPAER